MNPVLLGGRMHCASLVLSTGSKPPMIWWYASLNLFGVWNMNLTGSQFLHMAPLILIVPKFQHCTPVAIGWNENTDIFQNSWWLKNCRVLQNTEKNSNFTFWETFYYFASFYLLYFYYSDLGLFGILGGTKCNSSISDFYRYYTEGRKSAGEDFVFEFTQPLRDQSC